MTKTIELAVEYMENTTVSLTTLLTLSHLQGVKILRHLPTLGEFGVLMRPVDFDEQIEVASCVLI